MGMGWKEVRGGVWSKSKCKCGKGEVIISVSDYEESDYPPFSRGDTYSAECTCPNKCVDVDKMSQNEMEHYSSFNR
ncbi:hypothetical protein PMY38_11250 [Clostridium tertium]|jgi:hypothetical protein|uniref:hypothetical protein n=1 Tax=Clostridium TaxID=1485 RepID=UPI002331319C|nr:MULTISPECIES: hypothetical protein [Clostridium]MDB1956850.1 hypothetical protein [Clostridium tertium]MDB1959177.1 hypothetical protein [Clostridium tertium]MDB1963217.1 hypothetical protein [Clostridium tertium]MDB1967839.1 hypothetical protein [Clostridium tertium]MDU7086186.1 hypothetical protein [Clostridium sp.]